jgi:hypothetical protein
MQWVMPPDDNAEKSDDPYRSYGRFEPFAAKRLLERFTAKHIRFQIADASGLIPIGQIMYEPPTRIARLNSIEIFVHRDDEDKARKIISES